MTEVCSFEQVKGVGGVGGGGVQRAHYPLNKEYGLNYIGLHIMI